MPYINQKPVFSSELAEFFNVLKDVYPKAQLGTTFRTYSEQSKLYQRGRSGNKILDKKSVVTYADGGFSPHNYGLAFDIPNILSLDLEQNLKYNVNTLLKFYPSIEWGGNWSKEKYDPFHFEVKDWKTKIKQNPSPYIDFVRLFSAPDAIIYEKIWKPTKEAIKNIYKTGKSFAIVYLMIGFTGFLLYKKITK
jgi:hypothetical protein